jgi:pimeloyl-ACP methyl ester carboxylesterase
MKAAMLEVPGGSLYYEVRGSGPVLLLIPGGPADASGFQPVAEHLADSHTVVTYDCRGNSRSLMTGPREDLTVDLAAQDARRLLEAVGARSADVFGSSGGATYGLALVARHPGLVRTLVAYEPPLTELLPDAERWRSNNEQVGAIYRRDGVKPALDFFVKYVFAGHPDDGPGPAEPGADEAGQGADEAEQTADEAESQARISRNLVLFASWLIPHIGNYKPDMAGLRAASTRIVVGIGAQSLPTHMTYQTSQALAEQLAVELAEFPGDHFVEASDPAEFAARLRAVLGAAG